MQYNIQGETIREVTHAKYLGVTIDQHLSWSEHIKQITNKAYKAKVSYNATYIAVLLQLKAIAIKH